MVNTKITTATEEAISNTVAAQTSTEAAATEDESGVQAPVVPARMDLHIPKGNSNDDPNMAVIINGKVYLLPRGKTSNVPKAVYDEVMRARRAEEAQDNRVNEMVDKAVQEAQSVAQKIAL